ncbi:MAG: biotin--[acetyl-CoA-carboxylase] ligase [Tissierellia bacterium]|nr:biotin--[acetyl-CoA-carboxylase] ligase [Tissierellia bacterium]
MYDLNDIRGYLETKIIGQTIIQYHDLNSTYAKAKSIFEGCPDGTVVLSESQSNCDIGNEWNSIPNKNINFSIILNSVNNNSLIPLMDLVGCSSVHKSILELYNLESKIKWPKDMLINGRKISSVESNRGKAGLILSISINVNTDQVEDSITSIKIERGEDVEREELIGTILNNMEYCYEELLAGTVDAFVNYYNNNLLFAGKEVGVVKKGRKTVRKVLAKNIDSRGWLVVTNEKGNEEILNPGDIIIQYEEA